MTPVPAAVYRAARRAYLLSSADLYADDEAARAWAAARWPGAKVDGMMPAVVAEWVMSVACQDGHE